jgi:hypothetical protein
VAPLGDAALSALQQTGIGAGLANGFRRNDGSGFAALRRLLTDRKHQEFFSKFCEAVGCGFADREVLGALAGEALGLLLEDEFEGKAALLAAYVEQLQKGTVQAPDEIMWRLSRAIPTAKLPGRTIRPPRIPLDACREAPSTDRSRGSVILRRVVQIVEYGLSDFACSDSAGIRRSVFRSPQERSFCRALGLRFPSLQVLPNYPLDQLADLSRLSKSLSQDLIRYGLRCRLDAVLVVPDEGDAVAAFELDSRSHEQEACRQRDQSKDLLMREVGIPLYRLRAEDPSSVSTEDWYAVLTDQLVERINVGRRLRTRQMHTCLVPAFR